MEIIPPLSADTTTSFVLIEFVLSRGGDGGDIFQLPQDNVLMTLFWSMVRIMTYLT
ncbi:MAG TPA: hypothetical protein VFZ67_00100 [Nitrososphaera sp.]